MNVHALKIEESGVVIPHGKFRLPGDLVVPAGATGVAVFAHGSGSSRFSLRNQAVARDLERRGIGTLLFDLLTEAEEREESETRHLRFDIPLLAERLLAATNWIQTQEIARDLPLGYFGSSTGAAAAIVAAATSGEKIRAVVSRGGRPDLAGEFLPQVQAPTLLIVGGNDDTVVVLNKRAREKMTCQRELTIIPHATHLFEEPGALEEVARLAGQWFIRHFAADVL
jgi:putative phosphoribosyl transferase